MLTYFCPFCTDKKGRVKLKLLKKNRYKKNNENESSGSWYLCPVGLDKFHLRMKSNGKKRVTYFPKGESSGRLIDYHSLEVS